MAVLASPLVGGYALNIPTTKNRWQSMRANRANLLGRDLVLQFTGTGHGFVGLMRTLRVQRICRLLMQTERSVADICFDGLWPCVEPQSHVRHEMARAPGEYRRETAIDLDQRQDDPGQWPRPSAGSVIVSLST
jgi:hypothetical protein